MSGRRSQWWFVAIGVCALAVLVTSFLLLFEWGSEEVEVGLRGEARRNPYLALTRMLDKMGRTVHAVDNIHALGVLPPGSGTLFLLAPTFGLDDERLSEVLDWVEQGGHLVLVPDELGGPHVILDEVGFVVVPATDEESFTETSIEEGDDEAFTTMEMPGTDPPMIVSDARSEWGQEMIDEQGAATWRVVGIEHYRILQRQSGRGLVTVLSGAGVFDNKSIGNHDHAELAWRIASSGPSGGPVWVVSGASMPGLHTLIWNRGSLVVVSFGVLALLWVWGLQRRDGPQHPLPDAPRRGVLEHIEATANFLWQHRSGRSSLLDALRGHVLRRARKRIAGWSGLSKSEQPPRLAAATGIPVKEVASALREEPPRGRKGFVSRVRALSRIRSRL